MAEIIAQRPVDGIVMGKKEFLLAMDVMGLSASYDLASLHHTLMSNMKFETGEFNIMKELKDKAGKACIRLETSTTKLHSCGKNKVYLLCCHSSFVIWVDKGSDSTDIVFA